MANSLVASITALGTIDGVQLSINSGSFTVSIAGNPAIRNLVSIPTSDTSISLGGISTIGYVLFHNTDTTNFVTIGSNGSLYPIKLLAGEWAMMRWNAAAIHVLADTAAVILDYQLFPV